MRNLISIDDLDIGDISAIISLSFSMREVLEREIKKVPTLRGKVICLMFFESSTRTRVSFELAAKFLSADTVSFTPSSSAMQKGESMIDTIRTITALGADFLVVRHSKEAFPHLISKYTDIHIVNAGDGKNEHPSQALLDLFTMMREKGAKDTKELRGCAVSIIGDILHSRVARSDIKLFSKLGMNVTIVSPFTTIPPAIEKLGNIKVKKFIDEDVISSDFIMLLRIQKERHGAYFYPSEREYNAIWGIDDAMLEKLREKGTYIMHPGPMNIGVEVMPSIAYSDISLISEQVKNGVAVRMAILYYLYSMSKRE